EVIDKQMEALLPYYNKLEEEAMKIAEKTFHGPIHFSLKTKEQKLFTYQNNRHQYYCYLDGYLEKENEIYIFEVKATTSKKFKELGPRIKKIHYPLFTRQGVSYQLATYPDMEAQPFNRAYEKLYDRYSGVGRYVFDMAVEKMIVEEARKQAGLPFKKIHYYLTVLNSSYVFDGTYQEEEPFYQNIDGEELVNFIELDDIIQAWQTKIYAMKQTLEDYLETLDASVVPVGPFCERKKMSKCPFIPTCWEKVLVDGSILEYMGSHYGFKDEFGEKHDILDLINQGQVMLDSIPKRWLDRPNNLIQRTCFEEKVEYVDIDKIKKGLQVLQYPLYHLDFESFPSPLPRFRGEKPYAQSVFQYSLHIEQAPFECDKERDHIEYLALDFKDRREELICQMIHDIDLSQGGTVIVYNKSFEHSRIKEFAVMFPKYQQELECINDHMFDLLDLVKTRSELYEDLGFSEEESKRVNYYHNNLHGSFSIKKVLPVFSDLTYKGLGVANGTEAIATYAKFKYLSPEDIECLRRDLKQYCQQDTWAMVLVLWGLIRRINKKI
ncbi:MAG: DUF2779 domain-containing protein, partial [Bacilli bacterium]